MEQFSIHAAKTNLSKLIARVEAGEEIILARGNTPIVRLTLIEAAKTTSAQALDLSEVKPVKKRRIGGYKGMFSFDEAVFKPLTDEEMIEYGFE